MKEGESESERERAREQARESYIVQLEVGSEIS